MKLIAHRGNLNGPIPEKENRPDYIEHSIDAGFDCEIDLRINEHGELFLGHDEKQYPVEVDFLLKYSKSLWVHCKDAGSLDLMISNHRYRTEMNFFFHANDDYTMTSKGFIWAYPNRQIISHKCVTVIQNENMLNMIKEKRLCYVKGPYGICTDWVARI